MASTEVVIVAVFATLAFFGNVLITIVGLKLPSHPKNVTQIFLISLAVADILLSLEVPIYIMGMENKISQYPENESLTLVILCSVSGYLLWTSIKANVLMVMVMGLDRMLATCYASWYMKNVNRKPAILACVAVWTMSLLLAALPGLISIVSGVRDNPYYYDIRFQTCTPITDHCLPGSSKSMKTKLTIYLLLEQMVSLVIPFILILFFYICICSKIFKLPKLRTISRHFSKRGIFKSSRPRQQEERTINRDKLKHHVPVSNNITDRSNNQISQNHYNQDNNINDSNYARVGLTELSPKSVIKKVSVTDSTTACMSERSSCVDSENGNGIHHSVLLPITPIPLLYSKAPLLDVTAIHREQETRETSVYSVSDSSCLTTLNKSPLPDIGFCSKSVQVKDSYVINTNNSVSPTKNVNKCNDTSSVDDNRNYQYTKQPKFIIDPHTQRKRLKLFTTTEDESDTFGECEDPDATNSSGILASSINKIEKHYNAIENAREELAKKMRVYKYQIRVARTAIVICTLFIICYIPYITSVITVVTTEQLDRHCMGISLLAAGKSYFSTLTKYVHMLLFMNSAFNVLIYGMMHRTVRAKLMQIFGFCQIQKGNSSNT